MNHELYDALTFQDLAEDPGCLDVFNEAFSAFPDGMRQLSWKDAYMVCLRSFFNVSDHLFSDVFQRYEKSTPLRTVFRGDTQRAFSRMSAENTEYDDYIDDINERTKFGYNDSSVSFSITLDHASLMYPWFAQVLLLRKTDDIRKMSPEEYARFVYNFRHDEALGKALEFFEENYKLNLTFDEAIHLTSASAARPKPQRI